MHYIKFIEEKYNPFRLCRTIRIGNIDGYREFDATTGTGDPNEARFGMSINSNWGIETDSIDYLNSPLHTSGMMKNLEGKGNRIYFDNSFTGPPKFVWQHTNCFVYCFSVFENNEKPTLEIAQSIRPENDSAFEIGDVRMFADYLVQLIRQNTSESCLTEDSKKKIKDAGIDKHELQISIFGGQVEYLTNAIEEFSTIEEFREFSKKWGSGTIRCIFQKEERFRFQREFRIAFPIHHPALGILDVTKDWLDVTIDPNRIGSMCWEIPLKEYGPKLSR